MTKLTEQDAKNIEGGITAGALLALLGLGVFIIGFLDGLTKKLPCKAG